MAERTTTLPATSVACLFLATMLATASAETIQVNPGDVACVNSPARPEMCEYVMETASVIGYNVILVTELEVLEHFENFAAVVVDTKTAACINVEHDVAPVLTMGIHDARGNEVFDYGGVAFTRAGTLTQINDLKGKVIAATTTTDFASVHTVFAEYRKETSKELVDDAAMIQYLGSPDRVLQAVLSGNADVGLVHTGFLELSKDKGLFDWKDIFVVAQKIVHAYGARYPYYSSTPVYPHYAVFISADATPEYKRYVANAVFNANTTSNVRFTLTGSYAVPTLLLEQNGVIERDSLLQNKGRCVRRTTHFVDMPRRAPPSEQAAINATTPYSFTTAEERAELLICPNSHFRKDTLVDTNCGNRVCQDGAVCLCHPCEKLEPVQVHMSSIFITDDMLVNEVPEALEFFSNRCFRMDTCATTTQPNPVYFILNDKLYYKRPNQDSLRYLVSRVERENEYEIEAQRFPSFPHLAIINVTGINFGVNSIRVGLFLCVRASCGVMCVCVVECVM